MKTLKNPRLSKNSIPNPSYRRLLQCLYRRRKGQYIIALLRSYYIDFHTQLRWRNVLSLTETYIGAGGERALDLGAGGLDFALLYLMLHYSSVEEFVVAVYTDEEKKESASTLEVLPKVYRKKIKLVKADAQEIDSLFHKYFDKVFLIDVLEHLKDDQRALKAIWRTLSKDGVLILSVPTPFYKRFFGERFHLYVGHVRDGYTHKDIQRLCQGMFEVRSYRYYTNKLSASIVMKPFYRLITTILRYVLFFVYGLFYPLYLTLLPTIDNFRVEPYCSLVVRASKITSSPT